MLQLVLSRRWAVRLLPALLAAFAIGCAPSARPATAAPPDLGIPALLAETGVPSVSVARIEGGRLAWAGAWGQAGPDRPTTPATLYNIASLTKPITAETVLRAAAAGRLSLDESMAGAWVDPDIAGDPRHRLLTPRISLTHRTGFPNWRSGSLAFERDPGTAFGYSGEGFEYLARFSERRTATPFEQLAELYVFRPAGMTRTAYTNRPWFAGQVATPSDQNGQWLEPVIRDRFVASDDVHTTASDYARFLIGAGQGAGLGPAEAADRARVQASTREARCTGSRAASCPDEMGFGLGWDVAVFGEDRILWHTGGDQGEFTIAYIIPRTGEGMVILTNSAKGYRVVLPIMERAGVHPRFLAFLKAQAG